MRPVGYDTESHRCHQHPKRSRGRGHGSRGLVMVRRLRRQDAMLPSAQPLRIVVAKIRLGMATAAATGLQQLLHAARSSLPWCAVLIVLAFSLVNGDKSVRIFILKSIRQTGTAAAERPRWKIRSTRSGCSMPIGYPRNVWAAFYHFRFRIWRAPYLGTRSPDFCP